MKGNYTADLTFTRPATCTVGSILAVVLACTCKTDPYNCPQGQALVSAIIERKGNQ